MTRFMIVPLIQAAVCLFAVAARAAEPDRPPAPQSLQINFQGASLDTVLDYLSKAGGFIIVRDAPIPGTVDIVSHQPVSPDEAVQLLHGVLNDRGFGVIRDGRILRIVKLDAARTRDLPVYSGSVPGEVPKSSEVVTQIIPIRHTSAEKLIETLKPLLPATTTITANADSNALVITDTRINIRRMMEIVQALDTAVSSILDIQVVALQYADAEETAEVINKIYESPASTNASRDTAQSRRERFISRMRGGGDESAAPTDNEAKQTANYVKAVADTRANAVVVTAPSEVIPQIQLLVNQLDIPTEAVTNVRVFPLRYADPTEVANVIAGLYPTKASSTAQQQSNGPASFFGRGRFPRNDAPPSTASSTNDRKLAESEVIAVADTRTNAVIVSASAASMETIAQVVEQLDETPANVPSVYIYRLENADVTATKDILENMFDDLAGSGSTTTRSTTGSATGTGTPSNRRTPTATTTR